MAQASKTPKRKRDDDLEATDKTAVKSLFAAIEARDFTQVKALLEAKVDVNGYDSGNDDSLCTTILTGSTPLVRQLLQAGAEIDKEALYFACDNGHCQIAELLLDAKAEVDGYDYNDGCYNSSPLIRAASKGDVAIVEVLLRRKANKESVDENGWTPLTLAASGGHTPVMSKLIEAKAQLDPIAAENPWTPLQAAVQNGHVEAVDLLWSKGANMSIHYKSRTLLHLAASHGQKQAIEYLLFNIEQERGKPAVETALEAADSDGNTPLFLAAANRKAEAALSRLLDAKANLAARNKVHETALHVASQAGSKSVATLIAAKADIEAVNENKQTPLSKAAAAGRETVVVHLLEAKSSIDPRDKDQLTPLSLAAANGYEAVVDQLLKAKAPLVDEDEHIGSKVGASPLVQASKKGYATLVSKFLLLSTSSVFRDHCSRGMAVACEYGHVDVVRLFLKHSPDMIFRRVRKNNHQPLHIASEYGHVSVVQVLLAARAEIDARNGTKESEQLTSEELAEAAGRMAVVDIIRKERERLKMEAKLSESSTSVQRPQTEMTHRPDSHIPAPGRSSLPRTPHPAVRRGAAPSSSQNMAAFFEQSSSSSSSSSTAAQLPTQAHASVGIQTLQKSPGPADQ